ncbi:sensor histidine kinase [Paenibacillus hamazuiensis]|uniref:sensor histidine kinase n=1 Tax=Paenibacillus hamazuiensis TaxID=2936508 RepID=UPI00200D34CC|nr:ATP-binding protein [Paenibacillus hamazuiensis]
MKLRSYLLIASTVSLTIILVSLFVCYRYMLLEWNEVMLLGSVTIGAAAVSLVVHFILTRPLETSIRAMSEEASRIAGGHFEGQVPLTGPQEFRQLAARFNQMSAELQISFERLHASESSRRELVANVSHDLRTPMTSIQSFVEALEDDIIQDKETFERYLQTIRLETKRLSRLIDELFELSRLQAGSLEWAPEPCHVDSLIIEALQSHAIQFEEKMLKVSANVLDGVPQVLVMPFEIKRVLANLLENAIMHTPIGETLTVEAKPAAKSGYVRISVSDQGKGVPESDRERIFERFYRVDAARTRKSGGAGLGLAIAKSIVERHGGEIGVEREEPRGSRFWFTVPQA